jgi:hypothetical protein
LSPTNADRYVSEANIQEYLAENFHKFGFTRIAGPFVMGPDFVGEIEGSSTMIEVERNCRDYLVHDRHRDPSYSSVGVLVVFGRSKPRGAWRSLLPRKIIQIDQEDFRKWLADKEELQARKETVLKKYFDGAEIRLEKDGETIISTSIDANPELDLQDLECEKLVAYYSLVANEKRFRVMQELLKRRELSFSDILKITGNPKLVKDCVSPMIERGIITHDYGRGYRLSARGSVISSYLILAIPLVRKFLDGVEREALAELEDEEIE